MHYREQQQPEITRRRDAGILQITERDIITLTWIAEQYCCAFNQLQMLLGRQAKATTKEHNTLSVSATRHAIERWLQLGLIDPPRKIIREHPPYIWLSRRGLAQLGLPYIYHQPKPSRIKHTYATNSIRLHLESFGLRSTWYAHRLLIRERQERPQPDAELRANSNAHVAIQVTERPFTHVITIQETLETLETLLQRTDNGHQEQRYSNLWYFLHADAVTPFRQALAHLDPQAQQRIICYGLDAQQVQEDGG